MRNYKNKFLALLMVTTVAFSGCKKGDPIAPHMRHVTAAPATNNPTLTRGEWRISMLNEQGSDQTVNFRSYVFMFGADGVLKATKDNNTIEGTWLASPGSSGFMIRFPSSPLDELNADWHIKGETYNDLKLEHVSGGNGGTDILTFSRNQQQEPGNTSK